MRHIGESRAQFLDVRADERAREKCHDVVRNEHEVARVKARVHSARGVSEKEYLRAEQASI